MKELDEIRARIDAATKGPWRIIEQKYNNGMQPYWIVPGDTEGDCETYDGDLIVGDLGYTTKGDSEFIAHSPVDMDRMERALRMFIAETCELGLASDAKGSSEYSRTKCLNMHRKSNAIMRGED